jgi:phage terminase large subunit-like protein
VVTYGKTSDNASNLAASYLDVIYGLYEGTSLAAQELDGILMDEVEGALWSDALIAGARVNAMPQHGVPGRFVGVDPSVAENPKDECGIVVCYATNERKLHTRQAYVVGDYSVHGSPSVWVKAACAAARLHNAPIVAESNQGGELVRMAVAAEDPSIPVYLVHSYKGKALRAEPIVNVYEQGRIHHVGTLAMLESQMTSWVPGETKKSPDRVDALVFALTALMSTPPKGYYGPGGGAIRARAPMARLGHGSMNRSGIPKSPIARRKAGA